jgi:hypothetical protein
MQKILFHKVDDLPNWLSNAIESFMEHSPQWNIPLVAEGSCWTASKEFSDLMREFGLQKTHIQKVCFDSNCKSKNGGPCFCDSSSGSNKGDHEHDLDQFYPFESKRMKGYDADHRYNYLNVNGERINIDFTAKQFDEELPYPLIWKIEK